MNQEWLHGDSFMIVGQFSKIELQFLLNAFQFLNEYIMTA